MTYRKYFNQENEEFEIFAKQKGATYVESVMVGEERQLMAVWKDKKIYQQKNSKKIFEHAFSLRQDGTFSFGITIPDCDNYQTYLYDDATRTLYITPSMTKEQILWATKMLTITNEYIQQKVNKTK